MRSIEQDIKDQYSKIFQFRDVPVFKKMADYYFTQAAKILKEDIEIEDRYKLMVRNLQKRLFIGIGTELLLKSIFLKKQYSINLPKNGIEIKFPFLLNSINNDDLNKSNTYTLSILIENLPKLINISEDSFNALKICKVFRNKEGHVAVLKHRAVEQNYRSIEQAIIEIYNLAYNEELEFKISFLDKEDSIFRYQKIK